MTIFILFLLLQPEFNTHILSSGPYNEKHNLTFQQDIYIQGLSIMHRRSGNTIKSYPIIKYGDTIHYYKKRYNSFFRIYSFWLRGPEIKITKIEVKSTKKGKVLKSSVLIHGRDTSSSGGKIEFSDRYIEENEDHVELFIYYTDYMTGENCVFVFFVALDLEMK